jgi:hypothetical protein
MLELLRQMAELERRLAAIETLALPPFGVGARVYNSGALSVNSGVSTTLTFDTERFDSHAQHSTSSDTGKLTCVHPGKYFISGHARFASGAGSYRQLAVALNRTAYIAIVAVPPISGSVTILSVATLYDLDAGDYVELEAQQDSGGALNVDANSAYSPEFAFWRLA